MNNKYIVEDGVVVEVRKTTEEDKVMPDTADAKVVDWDNYFKSRS